MRELAPWFVPDLDKGKLVSPAHRAYQQDVGDRIRKERIHAIPERVVASIRQAEESDMAAASSHIVIDGIRNPSEMTYLRDRFPHFFVVAVFAPFDVRWKRREEDYGGNQRPFRRDDERDSGEFERPWGQKVQICVDRSDVLISNEGDFVDPSIEEELQGKLNSYIDLMRKPGSRGPHPWELNMAQAYEASLMSSCCKRRVGAIVVKEEATERRPRTYVIASGYNEAPASIRSCADRGGMNRPEYCYKDEKIKAVLKEQYRVCPSCGTKLTFPEEFDLPFICPNGECRARLGSDFVPGRMLDLCIAVHAEEAALLQASRFGGTEVDGSILYTTTFPCPLCAKMIVHAGIEKVFFAEPYPEDEAINALDEGRVPTELFEGVKGRAYHRLFEPPAYKPEGG